MTLLENDSNWFLAQYKPNCHQIAQRNLTQQGLPSYLPTHTQTRRARGRFVTQIAPLFPGYLFVAVGHAGDAWRKVNSTIGITRLVAFGREPLAVPATLVQGLMQRERLQDDPSGMSMVRPGDQVQLASGPFADLIARVEAVSAGERIVVLLEFLGGPRRITLPAAQLRAV